MQDAFPSQPALHLTKPQPGAHLLNQRLTQVCRSHGKRLFFMWGWSEEVNVLRCAVTEQIPCGGGTAVKWRVSKLKFYLGELNANKSMFAGVVAVRSHFLCKRCLVLVTGRMTSWLQQQLKAVYSHTNSSAGLSWGQLIRGPSLH